MAKTVVGLMDNTEQAYQAVDELIDCGTDQDDIGLMAYNRPAQSGETSADDVTQPSGTASSGTLRGAGTGAALGGIAGLALGLSSLAIPGLGPVIAAGPIASALAGAGFGAVAGGLVGALTHMGVPEEEAHYYAEGVRRGGTLLTVRATDDGMAETAADILREFGAVDINQRAEEWRQTGWSGSFQPETQAMEKSVRRSDMDSRPASQARHEAANQSTYRGPERRRNPSPWNGVERRVAAA